MVYCINELISRNIFQKIVTANFHTNAIDFAKYRSYKAKSTQHAEQV